MARLRLRSALALLIGALPALAGADDATRWTFEVRLPAEDAPLALTACSVHAHATVRFAAGEGAARDLEAATRSGAGALERDGDALVARDWRAGECLHVEVDLVAAAQRDRYGLGRRAGHFLRAAPQRWLWRPRMIDPDSTIRFAELPPGWTVSAPWRPVGDRLRLGDTPRDWPASVVFGRLHPITLVGAHAPHARVQVAVLPTIDAAQEREIAAWLAGVQRDVERLLGGFPSAHTQVLVIPLAGHAEPVPWGQTTRGGGTAVHLFIGAAASADARRDDWTAHHEFAHLLHPYLGERGRWLSEGLASYYQNVLRARGGSLAPHEAWSRLAAGFARGRAATPPDAASLERVAATRLRGSTMRVYWAGAAFWLEADLALRAHASSLDEVLARFHAAHGDHDCCWTPESWIDALHALAPAAALPARFRRHAEARAFPLTAAQVAALGAQVEQPGAPIAAVLARADVGPVGAQGSGPSEKRGGGGIGGHRFRRHGTRCSKARRNTPRPKTQGHPAPWALGPKP
ncbi:MAG: hypothetical protein LW860_00980 [Xanthomonadaceae bacterium]|jgi:hypothetical protein|nr:hypothetical protein [Xanthomonadaceae bacterium]